MDPAEDGTETIFPQAEALLEELCAISSPSGDADGLRAMAQRLGSELENRGLSVTIEEESSDGPAPQPLLVARGDAAGPCHVLLVGHLDTVLPAADPVRDGDLLRATGALDMKGGLVTLLGALDLLHARGEAPPADLLLVGDHREEGGGAVSQRTMRRFGDAARAVLVLEPGEGRDDRETTVSGRRGMRAWRLEVTGRASHSGLAFWEGRSALLAAADWCRYAHGLSADAAGPTVNVARMVAGAADFIAHPARRAEVLGTQRQLNVVPDSAVVEGEHRFLSLDDGERIAAALDEAAAAVAREHEVEVELHTTATIPPVDPDGPGRTLIERLVELAGARGWRLEVERDRGGISFPNFLPHPDRVPVVDGLGPVGVGMHTRQEAVSLGSLRRRIVLLADLLADL